MGGAGHALADPRERDRTGGSAETLAIGHIELDHPAIVDGQLDHAETEAPDRFSHGGQHWIFAK